MGASWKEKVESFKPQVVGAESKNHMNLKLVECIKKAQMNCAMGKDSNMNPKPKFNSEYYRIIGAVERIMDDVEESYTRISKDKVVKLTRHKERKRKPISRAIQNVYVIYKFRTSGIDSREMKFLGGRLFIHNNLGDREKRLDSSSSQARDNVMH
ncbi:hypothetical protein C2G38_2243118 [Gigaspora rosea]|uniref:Uncharacterized protein n=1 Tax=Gigaspora rosea TaxID=44941 RepID=A0A397VLN9_9GLOM|nr:hypothetical protein C2G38_2243118 [Gigaspora rosea]